MSSFVAALFAQFSGKFDELAAVIRKRILIYSLIFVAGLCGVITFLGGASMWLAEYFGWKSVLFVIGGLLVLTAIIGYLALRSEEARKPAADTEHSNSGVVNQFALLDTGISLLPLLLRHRRLGVLAGLGILAYAALDGYLRSSASEAVRGRAQTSRNQSRNTPRRRRAGAASSNRPAIH